MPGAAEPVDGGPDGPGALDEPAAGGAVTFAVAEGFGPVVACGDGEAPGNEAPGDGDGSAANFDATVRGPFILTTHCPAITEAQSPDHSRSCQPDAGVPVSVTVAPYPNWDPQVAPHVMPAGKLVTVPEPCVLMLSGTVAWTKAAVSSRSPRTTLDEVNVGWHVPEVKLQLPTAGVIR